MTDNLMAVIVGEDTADKHGVCYLTDDEKSYIRFNSGGTPMQIQMSYGSDAMGLEYDTGSFTVNIGNQKFVTGYYPYFTSEGWLECDNYEKFYFGGLMLKVNNTWYVADWVDPDNNNYEIVTFKPMLSMGHAFVTALKMAMEEYVKKSA